MRRPAVIGLVLVLGWVGLSWAQERTIGRVKAPAGESRQALVVGNAAYPAGPLRNPVNDARAMAEALRRLGFQATLGENLGHKELRQAILAFGRSLSKGGVALFYFAGHGLQVAGENYLVPIDAAISAEEEVAVEAVPIQAVMARLAAAETRLNLVILDACRDNPYSRGFRSTGSPGLATLKAPQGTLISFATAPGEVAADGPGQHGLFTEALVAHMTTPGLRIEEVLKRTRAAVVERSKGRQVPWESSSLLGEFILAAPVEAGPPAQAEEAERRRLEEERRRLVEEKARLEAERRHLAEAQRLQEEQRKLAQERARVEEERRRLEAERQAKAAPRPAGRPRRIESQPISLPCFAKASQNPWSCCRNKGGAHCQGYNEAILRLPERIEPGRVTRATISLTNVNTQAHTPRRLDFFLSAGPEAQKSGQVVLRGHRVPPTQEMARQEVRQDVTAQLKSLRGTDRYYWGVLNHDDGEVTVDKVVLLIQLD